MNVIAEIEAILAHSRETRDIKRMAVVLDVRLSDLLMRLREDEWIERMGRHVRVRGAVEQSARLDEMHRALRGG
ncbi:MAG: hypothetical protein KGL39_40855 [Patescibacteria group bacterium]|nr:hypothetical protein [Patescibacteria group bacterium]